MCEYGKVHGRVIAVGFCPQCRIRGVVISQDAVYNDAGEIEDWGPLQITDCACGNLDIGCVDFPLSEPEWQMLLKPEAKLKVRRDAEVRGKFESALLFRLAPKSKRAQRRRA